MKTQSRFFKIVALLTASLMAFSSGALAAKPTHGSDGGKGGKSTIQGNNAAAKEKSQGLVNLNQATEEQLRLLPRIGPSKAKAIIAFRNKRKFKATYELIQVKGIGRKTFRKLRPFLTVEGPTTLTEKIKLGANAS